MEQEGRAATEAKRVAWASQAAAGDSNALNALLRDIESTVLAHCRHILRNERDAEEAAQDALLAVSRSIGQFEGRSRFSTWLHRLTANAAIDCYRRLKRRQSVLVEPPPQAAPGSTPSVLAGARIDLLDAAEKLDPAFLEPVLLRDVAGFSYGEVAEALGVPVGTVKSRISEGRRRLRHALAERD